MVDIETKTGAAVSTSRAQGKELTPHHVAHPDQPSESVKAYQHNHIMLDKCAARSEMCVTSL